MAGAIVNDSEVQSYLTDTALSYAGTLLKIKAATAGYVTVVGAGEEPDGYSFMTTKHPVTGVAQANVPIGVCALIPGRKAELVLLATNAEIAIGDLLETTADGTVDKNSGAGWIIGKALEYKAASGGAGKSIQVRIDKYYKAS